MMTYSTPSPIVLEPVSIVPKNEPLVYVSGGSPSLGTAHSGCTVTSALAGNALEQSSHSAVIRKAVIAIHSE
jgi:hypothetical protein